MLNAGVSDAMRGSRYSKNCQYPMIRKTKGIIRNLRKTRKDNLQPYGRSCFFWGFFILAEVDKGF